MHNSPKARSSDSRGANKGFMKFTINYPSSLVVFQRSLIGTSRVHAYSINGLKVDSSRGAGKLPPDQDNLIRGLSNCLVRGGNTWRCSRSCWYMTLTNGN